MLEVRLRGVQVAAWCHGWSVLGDGRGEGRSLVFLPVMPVSPCAPFHPFGAVLAHLVCKICYFFAPHGATALRGKPVTEVNRKLNVPSEELKAARSRRRKLKPLKIEKSRPTFSLNFLLSFQETVVCRVAVLCVDGAACSLVRQLRLRLMNREHLPLGQAAWVTPSALQ